jgi:hypothetical protein
VIFYEKLHSFAKKVLVYKNEASVDFHSDFSSSGAAQAFRLWSTCRSRPTSLSE